jgi:hypothetical protein
MTRDLLPVAGPAAAIAVAVVLLLPASGWATTEPVGSVRQVGATAVVYSGPQVDVALSYHYAVVNPGGRWLLLNVVMAAADAPVELDRTAISVRTPAGEVIPLATPAQFVEAYPRLTWDIAKDRATREPLGLLTPRPYRRLQFFPSEGYSPTFDAQYLDSFRNAYGRLFFRIPDGIQKGTYELQIRLNKSEVVIPFTL